MATAIKIVTLIVDWAQRTSGGYRPTKGVPRPANTYRGARRNAYWGR